MFSGIVQAIGTVAKIEPTADGMRLTICETSVAQQVSAGESIAVNGACLTVVGHDEDSFWFDAVPETLAKTNLGDLQTGSHVNLEPSLAIGDQIHGHFVQGHVDATGTVDELHDDEQGRLVWFRYPAQLAPLLVPKGSVAVDGTSLTLVDVTAERFSIAYIPFTLEHTIVDEYQSGQRVNLEADILGKHVLRCLQYLKSDAASGTLELLKNAGLT